MSPETQEFISLLESSGMRDSWVADRLGVTRSAISQIRKGKSKPSVLMMRFLKEIIAQEKPEALVPKLHESPSAGDLELWKRRAKSAEQRFERMREGLRQLLDQSTNSTADDNLSRRAVQIAEESRAHRTGGGPLKYPSHQADQRKPRASHQVPPETKSEPQPSPERDQS